MASFVDAAQEGGRFRALLVPNRSLSRGGFLVLMGAVAAINLVLGVMFALSGAWPILFFCGLDVALVYVAFRISYRSGRAFELIEVAEGTLRVTRVDHWGQRFVTELNPYWARVDIEEAVDGRVQVRLRSHGRMLAIAGFLGGDERREVGEAISRCLARCREPGAAA